MNYCSHCGNPVTHRIPDGDNRHRYVCDHCNRIHYENPRIVAGTVPIWEGQVLLCRRAIKPRHGYWTLPAGFMENSETTVEAAMRETREEALAEVAVDGLYTMLHVPHIDQVHLFFRARLIDGTFGVGEESLDTQLFPLTDIPWEELAFPTIRETLERFVRDTETGEFPLHVGDIRYRMGK
ncbi:NUDIX hydrolase [Marinobacter sp. NFXS9]|uniref:NUDIX hydrolase n=1 Tax=Marinobacter sp. NFXS9 TaxID=2818433 RepID=UPI0032DE3E3C